MKTGFIHLAISKIKIALLAAALVALFSTGSFSQEINLDKMKKVGDLICYPSLKEPSVWYYLPDQPRLAMNNGKPLFSLMKYSRKDTTEQTDLNTVKSGGIVHFLITYSAGKDRVKAAEKLLQEENPDARLDGPIAYQKCSFALITSFIEKNEELVKTVAVGKAPLMKGQKAAVSMMLSRSGAEILWESFNSDTPDISLVFEMEFSGIREPYEATIQADWSRISKHKSLKAGLKHSWFGADVDMLFQELRRNGSIKITTKGKNADMDKIIPSANAKLLQVMFDPAPVDRFAKTAAEKDSYSSLNQAMKLINNSAGSTKVESKGKTSAIPKKNSIDLDSPGLSQIIAAILDMMASDAHASEKGSSDTKEEKNSSDNSPPPEQTQELTDLYKHGQTLYVERKYQEALDTFLRWKQLHIRYTGKATGCILYNIGSCYVKLAQYEKAAESYIQASGLFGQDTKDGRDSLRMAQQAEEKLMSTTRRTIGNNRGYGNNTKQTPGSKPQTAASSTSAAYNHALHLDETAQNTGYPQQAVRKAIDAYESYISTYSPSSARLREIEGRLRSLERRLDMAKLDQASGTPFSDLSNPDVEPPSSPGLENDSSQADRTSPDAGDSKPLAVPSSGKSGAPPRSWKPSKAVKQAADKKPGFSLVASFKMKSIKQSGKMNYNMNQLRSEKQHFTMTENIGSLYRLYGNDNHVFRSLTIDDHISKQREVVVTLDGQDTSTFTQHFNFVSVKLKKQHQSGEYTTDEIIITPELFNKKGNSFSFNYEYKEDKDKTRWLEYQYQTLWSFLGGAEVRTPWKDENAPMLSLLPPHRYKTLIIEGEGKTLKKARVRHAVITVTTMVYGKLIQTQTTIRNQGPMPTKQIVVPYGINEEESSVSIKWFLKGGRRIDSPVLPVEGKIIYWDELP